LLRAAINNEGPGRNKFCGKTMSLRKPEKRNQHCYAIRAQTAEEERCETRRPALQMGGLRPAACILLRAAGRDGWCF